MTVLTFGCWDLLHVGHLRFLRRSKLFGDRLVVAMASDHVIIEDKGKAPTIPEDQREEFLSGLKCVNAVIVYYSLNLSKVVKQIKPNVLTVGDDWEFNKQRRHVDAESAIKDLKGSTIWIPKTKGVSTSDIKSRIKEGR